MTGSSFVDDDDCDSKVSIAEHGGHWYSYNATCEGMPGDQTPMSGCAQSAPFEMETTPEGCRARTHGGGFPNSESEGFGYALIGIQLNAPLDVCEFGGIGFTSGGSSVRVKVAISATEADSDHYGAFVVEGTHELAWTDLQQEGWGVPQDFDCSAVTGLIFQAASPVEFDFWIDDVSLQPLAAGASTTSGGGSVNSNSAATGDAATTSTSGAGGSSSTEACDSPSLVWKTGRKTTYTSYPDPNSEECIVYNGCMWAGQFAHCNGTYPESWVAERNIAAVFPDEGLAGHDLCIRSGDRVMIVTAIDTCGDSDCDGCCTANRGDADALIDLESYTNARWGLPDAPLKWADLGPNPEACTQ